MTRAASDAKRRGAAALIINFAHRREVYALAHEYFASSFFVPRTPTRASRIRLWYGGSGVAIAGSVVLHGPGGRTAKRLKSIGSMVPFHGLTRDACVGACARAHWEGIQNHRTIELNHKTKLSCGFGGSIAVLSPVCSRTGNKEMGGYCLPGFAGGDRRRQSCELRYPGLDRGAAGRKFRGRARAAGGGDRVGAVVVGGLADRVISMGYAVRTGDVGMPLSERSAFSVPYQRVSDDLWKPAGLAGAVDLGGSAAPIGRGGVVAAGRGATPPSAARLHSLTFAQPIFRVSAYLRIRRTTTEVLDRHGCLTAGVKMGSGVVRLSTVAGGRRDGAIGGRQERVGVQGGVLGWGRSREPLTLWGGSVGVK